MRSLASPSLSAVVGVVFVSLASLVGCGSSPPPKVEEPVKEETKPQGTGPKLQMSQELGSIDERKVEQTFANLVQGALETCHKQGRDRIEYLTGDVKVFLRIDGNGRVRYGFFEDSTLGDRETEKCVMGIFNGTSWPKPDGGEAEVRSGFGWGPGGEREPASWSSDKVTTALAESKDVKKDVDKCRRGVSGDFRVTAYVEADDGEHGGGGGGGVSGNGGGNGGKHGKNKPATKPKHGKQDKTVTKKESGGRFKAVGIAPPNKDGAEKVDCLVDALKLLELPSPGSYAAKVTFSL